MLLLEAGPAHDESRFQGWAQQGETSAFARVIGGIKGQPVQARDLWYTPDRSFLFVNDLQNPYTCAEDFFLWIRGRQVGGRFLAWGRVGLRMSDYDFKAASRDGIGEDWPISYQELAPYYDHVENFLKLRGTSDNIPNLPDGKYVAEAGLGKLERRFKQTVESSWPERRVVPWRYVTRQATPVDPQTGKRITAPIAAALQTGRLTLRPDAIVSRININPGNGRASGVSYIDRHSRELNEISADVVMLCASTIESVRLLLNSACSQHPDGVGNSSGLLGRYFMDHCPAILFGNVPDSYGWELVDGNSAEDNHGGIYIPRYQNLETTTHSKFARGFNIQGIIGRGVVDEDAPATLGMMAQGEMLPYHDSRIMLDANKKDAWGIPVARIRTSMTNNEREMVRCQVDSMREMVDACGWSTDFAISVLGIENPENLMPNASWLERLMFRLSYRKSIGLGAAIHECGGARMGEDAGKSILNPLNQCWDAPNVFVTDSSCFVTSGAIGPTLTSMALTVRACEFITREYGSNNDLSA